MSIEIDKILADIIQTHMIIPDGRIVLYNQDFDKPTDRELFIVISTGPSTVIGNTNTFDDSTDEEISSTVLRTQLIVELTSYDKSAKLRSHEVWQAIRSTYSQQIQETNNIQISRGGDILDISGVDGAKSLNRSQVPIYINYVKTKRTAITPIDKFQPTEVLIDE
jgi:hypothetical protein